MNGDRKMSTRKIIREIAKKHGVTTKEVVADMKQAIRTGMASREPQAQLFWRQVAPDGKEPSIDTFLKFCAKRAR